MNSKFYFRKTILTLVALFSVLNMFSQFSGLFAPANWNFNSITPGGDGSVNTSGAPGSIILYGSDNSSGMCCSLYEQYSITIPANGKISFSYNHFNPDLDDAQYVINGVVTQITDNGSGSLSNIVVNSGDVFSFRVTNYDNCCGRADLTISNFVFTSGAALNFDGSNDFVNVGTIIPANSSYTKEAWIYANASGSNNIISSSSAAFWLAGNKLSTYNNGGSVISDPATFPLNQWVHVAVTFNSANSVSSLYKNGVLVNSGVSNPGYTNDAIAIGQFGLTGLNFFQGSIDEVRIWNVARTQCEINTFKNCEIPTTATGLVANYHFNQGIASSTNTGITSLLDDSGSASTGTLTNFALTGSTSNWIAPGAVVTDFSTPLALPVSVFSTTNVACNGGSTGSVTATTSGGTPTYTYLWSNGATTSSLISVGVGIYTRTVTDAATCKSVNSATITQPSALATSTAVTSVACNGGSNGVASITASGGAGGYTYLWSNGATTSAITGLLAGAYSATVTDANGCKANKGAIVTQPSALVTTTAVTSVACNGGSNGVASITASGGAGGYTYLWSNGATTSAITGLMAAAYTATVTDANSCTSIKSANVSQPTALATTTAVTSVACNGGSNGVAAITASGGAGGYTYIWSNGATTSAITGLLAGAYSATVTDANSCTNIKVATVTQPSALVTTTAISNVSCNGGSNGVASVTASGGAGGYTYLWSNGATTSAITGLLAGAYSATVTDANSCTNIKVATVTQPSALVTTTAISNVSCNGGSNGVASITASGGAGSYTYIWSNGTTTSANTGLMPGVYTATVTDANSCTSIKSANVSQPTTLATTTAVTNVACNGGSNGVASITASGGAGSYTYIWSNGATTSAITGIMAGAYSATVTDANSCTTIKLATVTQPSALATSTAITNILCNGGNGSATITATGGTGTKTYLWSTGATTSVITNVAGVYTATVTDANGCKITANATITQPSALVTSTSFTNVACNGGNGSAIITATGGTASYTYLWSNGAATSTLSVLAGVYTATVTDANNCNSIKSVTITQPTILAATITSTNTACGSNTGSAAVSVSGGAGSYTYAWSPSGGTGATASSLGVGTYSCLITDANLCTLTKTVSVITSGAPTATLTAQSNVTCNGLCNGTASIAVSGGVAPYTYLWSNGNTAANATGFCAGAQTCTITGNNGCSVVVSVIITQPTLLMANANASSILCNGGMSSVTITAMNGTSVYTGIGTYTALAGTQTYTVTDANGCMATTSIFISEPALLIANASNSPILCNGGMSTINVTATGGTIAYTGVGTFTATAGTQTYTVTDANGCMTTTSLSISEPSVLVASATASPILCNGDVSSVTVFANGGITYYTGVGTYTAMAGTETYTVTDANGCMTTTSVSISEPAAITSIQSLTLCQGQTAIVGISTYSTAGTFTDVIASLINGCDSTITTDIMINTLPTVAVNSGVICSGQSFTMMPTGAITYTYSNGSDVAMPTIDATYTVVGTDANGCEDMATSSVTVNALPVLTASTTNTLMCAGETATLSVTGATSYTWSTSDNTPDIAVTPSTQTTYTVDGTDANGCVSSTTITQDVSLCTGINNLTLNSVISVYPNPANGILNIDLGFISSDVKIEITNAIGQLILTEMTSSQHSVIDIHQLSNGVYFVKISQQNINHTIKLVKQN